MLERFLITNANTRPIYVNPYPPDGVYEGEATGNRLQYVVGDVVYETILDYYVKGINFKCSVTVRSVSNGIALSMGPRETNP